MKKLLRFTFSLYFVINILSLQLLYSAPLAGNGCSINVNVLSPTSVNATCIASAYLANTLVSCEIKYWKLSDPSTIITIPGEGGLNWISFTTTISDLTPNTNYVFQGVGYFSQGGSPVSSTTKSLKTPISCIFIDGSGYVTSVSHGNTDQPIGCFWLNAGEGVDNSNSLNSVSIKLNGIRTGASNFKLWESDDNAFGGHTQIGSTIAADPGDGGIINFNSFISLLTVPNKCYFITCDLESNATGSIQPLLINNSALTFTNVMLSNTITNAPLSSTATLLPVELASFTVLLVENRVTLNWQTATEINNYGFEIERDNRPGTIGNSAWEKIGFVNGSGNSNSTKQYSFEDDIKSILSHALATKITLQYRLKQIDNDGNYEYSDIVEVEVNNMPTEFSLYQNYPNPFNPSTTIKFALPVDSKVVLEVYNTLGEKVAELVNKNMAAGYHQVQLNGSGLASGVYIYRIRTGNGIIFTKKLMLLK